MAAALAKALIRKGLLQDDDVYAAADELARDGEATGAHVLRCAVLEARVTPDSEWSADRARGRFRVIEGGGE